MLQQRPKYRALEDHVSFGLAWFNEGAEIEWDGWPKVMSGKKFEAVNEPAKRILAYWRARHSGHGFPLVPYNNDHGRIFLPHVLPWSSLTRMPGLPAVERDGMPRYRAVWQQQFGGKQVQIGDEFAFCGWPNDGLEPINDEARQVCDYLVRHRDNPKLLTAPYCDFMHELFLPELPDIPTQRWARDISQDARDPWHEQFMRDRLAAAVKSLNQPPKRVRRGSRRRVSAQEQPA